MLLMTVVAFRAVTVVKRTMVNMTVVVVIVVMIVVVMIMVVMVTMGTRDRWGHTDRLV